MKFLLIFDEILERLSRWGLVSCLFCILLLSMLSIVLRWLGSSLMWSDPLVRHLVFFSAFLGGSLATSKGVHIKVDLFTHLVARSESKVIKWLHRNLVLIFCFLTTLTLTIASWDFFKVEKEFGNVAFLHIHSSYLVALVPIGMGLITLRFFNRIFIGEVREHLSL